MFAITEIHGLAVLLLSDYTFLRTCLSLGSDDMYFIYRRAQGGGNYTKWCVLDTYVEFSSAIIHGGKS